MIYPSKLKEIFSFGNTVNVHLVKTSRGQVVSPPPDVDIPPIEPEPSGPTILPFNFTFKLLKETIDTLYMTLAPDPEGRPWALWDVTDAGNPIELANSVGYITGNVEYTKTESQGYWVNITHTHMTMKKYSITGHLSIANLGCWPNYTYDFPAGYSEEVQVHVESWSDTIGKFELALEGTVLTVPYYLPRHITDTSDMFFTCTNFNQDISMWDMSNVTNMGRMLLNCDLFNQPIGVWDTSNVTNMSWLLSGCRSFNQPLNDLNVTNVTTMSDMFGECEIFNQPLDNWNISAVTTTESMFGECKNFNQDISMWDVGNVTNMYGMFTGASLFNQDLSPWCVTNIPTKPYDFDRAATVWRLPRPVWGTCPGTDPVTEISPFVFSTTKNGSDSDELPITIQITGNEGTWALSDADTGTILANKSSNGDNPITMNRTGSPTRRYKITGGAANITLSIAQDYLSSGAVTVESFSDTVNSYNFKVLSAVLTVPSTLPVGVTSTMSMFEHCYNFNQDISGWNVGNVTNMSRMFYSALTFNQQIGTWNTSNVTTMMGMFYNCANFNGDISSWDVGKVINMYQLFQGCAVFNQNLNNWNTVTAVNLASMFMGCTLFNSPLNNWNTGNVVTMANMFQSCVSFNQPLGNWNTAKVTTLSEMFSGATLFNQNISTWNVSAVTSTSYMFSQASSFNSPLGTWTFQTLRDTEQMFSNAKVFNQDISTWNVSTVYTMNGMFYNAIAYNQPLNTWNTAVLGSAYSMFWGCASFNQPLDNWNTGSFGSSVGMSEMFTNCSVFNQDLSSWCVTNCTYLPSNFASGAYLWSKSKPVWGTCDTEPARYYSFDITTGPTVQADGSYNIRMGGVVGGWTIYEDDVIISTRDLLSSPSATTSFTQYVTVVKIKVPASTTRRYRVEVTAESLESTYYDSITSVKPHVFNLTQFSNGIGQHMFKMLKITLAVPTVLPSYVTNLTSMFESSDTFNQDISGWDVSRVTKMSGLFRDAKQFNQDLSQWCVTNIAGKPYDFDQAATAWTLPRPVWGTCPRGENVS